MAWNSHLYVNGRNLYVNVLYGGAGYTIAISRLITSRGFFICKIKEISLTFKYKRKHDLA
jgi:hypothetical protein